MIITINYYGHFVNLRLSFSKYRNGQTAIQAWEVNGEPFATLTVALLAGDLIPEGYIALNHDCDHFVPELVRVGLIAEPEFYLAQGYVDFKIAKLLVDPETGEFIDGDNTQLR